jgi:pSer/pThr/pTyr-binding forkhead associated (FHA) protein
VKQGPRGEWLIHDAGSTNGTTLNGRSVPQQGSGPAVEMKSGDDIRLGQVELTFLEAEALISFALKVER